MSIESGNAIALVISCLTAQILENCGSSSSHADHSMDNDPGVPPDIGSALIQSGGLGISSVGVVFPVQVIGSPKLPSGYSIDIADLYCLVSLKAA